MDSAALLEKLSPAARKVLDPAGPAPLRQMAAKAIAPGLRPFEAVTVVTLMAQGEDALAETARATLKNLPPPILAGALTPELPAAVLDVLAPHYAQKSEVMEKFLALPQLQMETVETIAQRASEM